MPATVPLILKAAIRVARAPLVKRRQFIKRSDDFYRHHGGVGQVVRFRPGWGNNEDRGSVSLECRLYFRELARFEGWVFDARASLGNSLELPPSYLSPDIPTEWRLTRDSDARLLGQEMAVWVERLLSHFDTFDSALAFLQFPWPAGMPLRTDGLAHLHLARLHYMLGHDVEAAHHVEQMAAMLSSAVTATKIIEGWKFTRLEVRGKQG